MLKKRLILLAFLAFTAIGLLFLPQKASASDVWIGTENYEGKSYDYYIDEDSIAHIDAGGVYGEVKCVRNEELTSIVKWYFYPQYRGWLYETDQMIQHNQKPLQMRPGTLARKIWRYCYDYLN